MFCISSKIFLNLKRNLFVISRPYVYWHNDIRHCGTPILRLKPAPKGERHVDVDPAVHPRCNPRTPSVDG